MFVISFWLFKYLGTPAAESSEPCTSAALVSSGEFNVSVNVCDDKNVLTYVKMTICCAMFHPANVFALYVFSLFMDLEPPEETQQEHAALPVNLTLPTTTETGC